MEQPTQAEATPRRVKIGESQRVWDEVGQDRYKVTEFANTRVIPVLLAYGWDVTTERVLHYCTDLHAMYDDKITEVLAASHPDGIPEEERAEATDRAAEEVSRLHANESGKMEVRHAAAYFVAVTDGHPVLTYSTESIKNAAALYMTDPEQIAAYDRQAAAVEAINNFLSGHVSQLASIGQYFYIDRKEAKAKAVILSDYTQFIKPSDK